MHKIILTLCFVWSLAAQAQQLFPNLHCETLADKALNIPADVKGKKTVICLAMSPKAEKMLRDWNNPLYNSLVGSGMGGLMGGRMYDVNLCFVGMLKGIAKLGLNEAKKQSKKEISPKQYNYFMVSDDDVKALMNGLNISDVKEPHFFVLDADGQVIFHTQGEFSDNKLNSITEMLL